MRGKSRRSWAARKIARLLDVRNDGQKDDHAKERRFQVSLTRDNGDLAVVQDLAIRLRVDGAFVVSDEEFAAVQAAVRLMSDLPDAPAMPATKDDAEEAVRGVNSVMWRQLKLLSKIVGKILEEWVNLGAGEAERRARERVAELDGNWARASGESWVNTEIRGIREDELAGISPSEMFASKALIDAARAYRKARDYKGGLDLIMAALPDRIWMREKVNAMHLAGELALSAGLFQEAADVLTDMVREEELRKETYNRSSALTMRAYAFVELGDWNSAMADIVEIEDDLQMFWIPNVPMLTKKYLLERSECPSENILHRMNQL